MNWHATTLGVMDMLWLGAIVTIACLTAVALTGIALRAVVDWLRRRGAR